MSRPATLQALLAAPVSGHPDKVAVDDPERGTMSYGDLDRLSGRLRDRLVHLGVKPGDRVGLYLRKSVDAVAAIFGVLKAGGAYVPVDPGAPVARCAYILNDCTVRVVVIERRLVEDLTREIAKLGPVPTLLVLEEQSAAAALPATLDQFDRAAAAPPAATVISPPEAMAYVLYTSGSTGKPKGVMLSQRSAMRFVDWCSQCFQPTSADVFSSHAPLHFDLSILDLFVALKHGATLVLVGEEQGKDPVGLAPLIAAKRISIWYSTPSILSLLAQYGKLERYDLSPLRMVLFAGEVFPIPQLKALKRLLPAPRYFNLYGPTETNVCTWFELPAQIPEEQQQPFPIGRPCAHYDARVVDENGSEVGQGEPGELCIAGDGVMTGYWNRPDLNQRAFLVDPAGRPWYRTGDVVVERSDGVFIFHGRRDRMVKRRGYRVELGEIEAGLSGHDRVREVAVVAVPDPQAGVKIKAFLSPANEGPRLSIIELKAFCAERLPRYMIPDTFGFLDALPRTATDKIDYQRLKEL